MLVRSIFETDSIVGSVGNFDFACITTGTFDGRIVFLYVGRLVGGSDGAVIFTNPNMYFLNFLTLIDPNPEAGSHPGAALKPSLQHRVDALQLFFPVVISFMKTFGFAYKAGLIKPIAGPPPRNLAALMSDSMPATTGDDTEVPPAPSMSPPTMNRYPVPATLISG